MRIEKCKALQRSDETACQDILDIERKRDCKIFSENSFSKCTSTGVHKPNPYLPASPAGRADDEPKKSADVKVDACICKEDTGAMRCSTKK